VRNSPTLARDGAHCRSGFVHEAVASDFGTPAGFDVYNIAGRPPMVEAVGDNSRRAGAHKSGEAAGSPETAPQTPAKWQAWFKDMTEKGQLKSLGQRLDRSSGKVVEGRKTIVTDGPYAESKEVIGGYSLIEARNLDEAARIASGCPILEIGGSVEVRPVFGAS
jgi:hypothetical protein